jgi:hypothetical protein
MQKGIFEFEVGEPKVKRGFKFGTFAFAVACKEDGTPLSELLKKIGVGVENPTVDIMALLNVFYGAAVQYAKEKRQPLDFHPVDISNWMDELGVDEVTRILTNGLTQYSPKNSETLAETRETVTP